MKRTFGFKSHLVWQSTQLQNFSQYRRGKDRFITYIMAICNGHRERTQKTDVWSPRHVEPDLRGVSIRRIFRSFLVIFHRWADLRGVSIRRLFRSFLVIVHHARRFSTQRHSSVVVPICRNTGQYFFLSHDINNNNIFLLGFSIIVWYQRR